MRRIATCGAVALRLLLSPAMAGPLTSTTPVHVAPIHIAPVHVAPVVHVNPPLHPSAVHATPAVRATVVKPLTATKPTHADHHAVQTVVPVAITRAAQTKKCAQAKPGEQGCTTK